MAIVRERNGRYTGVYKVSGKQKSAGTFDTHEEAFHAARLKEADRVVAVAAPNVRGELTVAGYMPVFLEGHKLRATSRETYEHQSKHIIAGLGNIPLRRLTPADVRTFGRRLEASDLAGATVRRVMTILRQMCRMAVVDGKMDSDPTATIQAGEIVPREMRILSDDEYRAILGEINPHYRLLVRLMWSTGMRWGEALAVRPDAVYQRGNTWFVRVKRTYAEVNSELTLRNYGKTAKAYREISIPADLAQELLAIGPAGFKTVRGDDIIRTTFRREWVKAQRKAGITELARVHDIRHTHASKLANDPKIPLVYVRDRLGHGDISTTSRYVHVTDTGMDDYALRLLVS